MLRAIVLSSAMLALAVGCSTERQTDPTRTATEQLLVSTALDNALRDFHSGLPAGTRVWLDTANFDSLDEKYAIGAIRNHLAREGALLVEERPQADVVVEIRSGALSIDDESMLLGIPSLPVPVPLVGVMETPELPILKRAAQTGVAKIGITIYDARTGGLAAASPATPIYGFSTHKRWHVLLIGWTESDLLPKPAPPRVGGIAIPDYP